MCGRYRRRSDKQKIAEAFSVKVDLDQLDFAPGDDIAPRSFQPVVFTNDDGERDMEFMYWGFTFPRHFTINTRADSILKSGIWKTSFEKRRCVVPADSFFEWKRLHKRNNPKYEITIPDREPFALAGIWSMWRNKEGDQVPTVSIIVTSPCASAHALRLLRHGSSTTPQPARICFRVSPLPTRSLLRNANNYQENAVHAPVGRCEEWDSFTVAPFE